MKLKKLIPLVTATGITAIAAPLATSCSLPEGWVDGKAKLDTTNFAKHEGEITSPDFNALTTEYLSKDTKVMSDDFAYYLTQLYEDSDALKLSLGEKARVTEFEFSKLQGKLSDFKVENATAHTVSYTIEMKFDVKIAGNVDDLIELLFKKRPGFEKIELGDLKLNLALASKFTFTKVPVAIYYDYVRSVQNLIGLMRRDEMKGLALTLDTANMTSAEDWQVEGWLSTNGFITNDDIYIDLGLAMPEDKTLKITAETIKQSGLPPILEEVLLMASRFLGGWSTYYYSDFVTSD